MKDLHPTVDEISEMLKQVGFSKFDLKDDPGEEQGMVITGWKSEDSDRGWMLFIDPIFESGLLVFVVPQVAHLDDDVAKDRQEEVMRSLLQMNTKILLGDYGLDSGTGYITFTLTVPISAQPFTAEQFASYMATVVEMTAAGAGIVEGIVDGSMHFEASTGRLEEVAVPMEEPHEELMREFEAWLRQRNQGSN